MLFVFQEMHVVCSNVMSLLPMWFSKLIENILIFCFCGVFVLNRLQAAEQHERAAAVALFNNKIREAIEILSSQKANKNTGGKGEVLVYFCSW